MISAGLYVRVSSTQQAEKGYSIGEQQERLSKYCDAMGWQIFRIYTDAGFTGANINRPALTELLRDVKLGKVNRVVVYKLDRLSRSQKDTLSLIEDSFLKYGADFVSMSENFDTSTPFGRATVGILAVFAQLEREQIKERLYMGQAARVKNGKYKPCRNVIPGYIYEDGKLTVNPEEAEIVRKMFDLALHHVTPARIATELNNSGMIPAAGEWNERNVRHRLKSRTYIGEVSFAKQWYQGIHQPIIDRETFEEVNRWLADRKEAHTYKGQRDGKVVSYLGGLIYCARCGGKYSYRNIKAFKGGKEVHYKQYVCNSRRKQKRVRVWCPDCRNKNWNAEELESLVFGEIKKLSLDPDWMTEPKKEDNRLESIEKGINKADAELSRLIDLYAIGNIPIETIQKRIEDIQERKEKLEEEAERLKEVPRISIETAKREVDSFADVLEYGTFQDIRAVITDLIEKIEIDGEDITIYWRFT